MGHGSGCTAAISGMQRYLYHVYCQTPPSSLHREDTQNPHKPTVLSLKRGVEDFQYFLGVGIFYY